MKAEIVMIGTELLLGQIVDTNAAYMAKALANNGIDLYFKTTVGDNRQRIITVLDTALNRADVVLTSGGLGPTEDDITRECIAELTGRPLEFRTDLYEQLAARFARMKRPMTDNNRKQAFAPQGAIPIPNPNGTAPGLIVEDPRGVIISMPGVPRELIPMLDDQVIPYLVKKFDIQERLFCRVLKVCGIGESRIDAVIGDLIQESNNPKIGLLASPDAVRIRLSAKAKSKEEAEQLLDELHKKIEERLPHCIMGIDDDTLEMVIDRLLQSKNWTLAVAETSTGGLLAHRLTIAKASQFRGGIVLPLDSPENQRKDFDLIAGTLREKFDADCSLILLSDIKQNISQVEWRTPEDSTKWQYGFASPDDVNAARCAVVALEHVRRNLLGVVDDV